MYFLKEPEIFRAFSEGLTELLTHKGINTDSLSIDEMTDLLYDKLRKIGSSISNNTVFSWFRSEHRPKIEAGYRKQIYEICFTMELTDDETVWFFHHVYYDRAFNCYTVEEAVYFYAIRNHLTYQEADLFICEGMYGDEEKCEKVAEKKHMLFSEAARLAKAGEVSELWLTHYSPALTNPRAEISAAGDIFPNTKAAADRFHKTLNFIDE